MFWESLFQRRAALPECWQHDSIKYVAVTNAIFLYNLQQISHSRSEEHVEPCEQPSFKSEDFDCIPRLGAGLRAFLTIPKCNQNTRRTRAYTTALHVDRLHQIFEETVFIVPIQFEQYSISLEHSNDILALHTLDMHCSLWQVFVNKHH